MVLLDQALSSFLLLAMCFNAKWHHPNLPLTHLVTLRQQPYPPLPSPSPPQTANWVQSIMLVFTLVVELWIRMYVYSLVSSWANTSLPLSQKELTRDAAPGILNHYMRAIRIPYSSVPFWSPFSIPRLTCQDILHPRAL